MSSNSSKNKLFFKRLLLEQISNPDIYKIYKSKFGLNLDYDLSNEDIQYLTEIINQSDNLDNLTIRLSETLTEVKALNKLLRKILVKKQIINLTIFTKYLKIELFNEFLHFLSHINYSINSFKIKIKYNDSNTEELNTKLILENLLKNDNNYNINDLYLLDFRFNTEQNINLLNEYLSKSKNKIKNIYIYNSLIYSNKFNIDISHINIAELSNSNLSQINFLPLEKLNLSYNNISITGIKILSNLLINSKLKKLNLSKNYLGDEGCSILAEGIKFNKSLISINLSRNYIIYQGIVDLALSMKSNDNCEYNSSIKKINLSRNSINNSGLKEFCEILKNEPENRFTKINLQYNYITDLSINYFGEFLQNFPEQTFLSLTHWINEINQVNFFNYCQKFTKYDTKCSFSRKYF